MVKVPRMPSAKSVQMNKKPPLDVAIAPPTPLLIISSGGGSTAET
jgi:hypothetical protein